MSEPTITLVVIGKTHADLAAFRLQPVRAEVAELILVANPAARFGKLGALGNHYLDHALSEVVILLHADVVLEAGMLRSLARVTVTRHAVAGIVGVDARKHYTWCHAVTEPAEVSTLDSCCVAADARSLLRFDTATFDGFHCCVEDLCLQARSIGRPVLVAPGRAQHLGSSAQSAAWLDDYRRYREKLYAKWPGVAFETT